MSFRFYTTAVLLLTAFGLFGVSLFYTPDVAEAQASWACSVDGNSEVLRTFELGSSAETATMGVYTNADDPDNLYSTVYTRNAMTTELTTVNVSGSSPDSGSYSNAVIEDLGHFNGNEADAIDFSSPSSQEGGDLYDDMSIAPEDRGDVARVYYPSPPSSPSEGDTWSFNFDYYGTMTSQSPSGTPPQDVEWNVTVSCSASGGSSDPDPEENNPPTANDDGEPGDRICIQEGSTTNINVLKNDSDPDGDSLSIDSFPSVPSRGVVNLTTEDGDQVVAYTPSSTGDDSFTYQISDGNGGTDTASVYLEITSGCGQVTADISADIEGSSGESLDGATIIPRYDGNILSELPAGDAASTGWNVQLDETPRLFEIRQGDVNLPEGYDLPDIDWIQKFVEDDKTGQPNTAELGKSHSYDAPTASFTYSPSSPGPGEAVGFDASGSSDSDGSIVDYSWTFGDGSTGSGVSPSHSYSSGGDYNVNLTVTDDDGETDSTSDTVSVDQPNRPPTANFSWSFSGDPCSGFYADVAFQGSLSSDPDGDSLDYSWTFGDGGTASVANPVHSYPSGSTDSSGWLVRLTVDDGEYTDMHEDGVVISCSGGGGGGGGSDPGPSPEEE